MINAERRGVIAGSEEARKQARLLDEFEIKVLAIQVFNFMLQRGYAHIEPQETFIKGFLQGFKFTSIYKP